MILLALRLLYGVFARYATRGFVAIVILVKKIKMINFCATIAF
jgi:hypothetical protein